MLYRSNVSAPPGDRSTFAPLCPGGWIAYATRLFNIVADNHTLVYRPSTNKRKLSRSDQRIAKKFRHRARVSSVRDGRGWRDTRGRFAVHFNGGRASVGGFRSFRIGGRSSLSS